MGQEYNEIGFPIYIKHLNKVALLNQNSYTCTLNIPYAGIRGDDNHNTLKGKP